MLMLRDICEVCSMIQRLNSYSLLTDKLTEKVPYTIYRPDKKEEKKYRGVRNELFIKASNINLASVFVHVRKNF